MRRLALLFFLAAVSSGMACAQQTPDKIACYDHRKDNPPFKKKLWDGYEISLGPSRNPEAVEDKCTAAIYNSAGRVVFRTNGFSVVFDEEVTGKDFDGDGKPEVVFRTDSGGGMHCCWAYVVFSLSPKPHKLFEIAMDGRVDFEKDKDGKMVIWQRSGGPAGFTSMAQRPFAEKVLRVRDAKLVDATPEFCQKIFSEEMEDYRIEKRVLTPENLKKLEHTGEAAYDYEEVASALESRALQHVFCHEFDEALKDLKLWPAGKREIVIKSFAESLAQDYPEFAAKLQEILKKK
jgi:hypothetical protein